MKNISLRKLLLIMNLLFLFMLVMFSNPINAETEAINHLQERSLNDILHKGHKYVIVGDKGTMLLSEDRIEWKTIDINTDRNLNAITWWNNRFIAVGEDTILTSTDGKMWEKHPIHIEEKSLNLRGVYSNQDMIVSVGAGLIVTSMDGQNWKTHFIEPTMVLNDILYKDNQFIAVGSIIIEDIKKPLIMTSTDANQWTEVVLEDECAINEIAYIDGQYRALGENGQLFLSINGQDWTSQDEKFIGDRSHIYDFRSLAMGNHKMLMAGKMSHWMYTDDIQGIVVDIQKDTMEIHAMINGLEINKIYWDGSAFFTIGRGINKRDIFMSLDGKQWQLSNKYDFFTDVNPSDWFYDAIAFLKQNGRITGYDNQSFRPHQKMSIEEFIVLVLRAIDEDAHVSHDRHWASDSIEKAISLGWIKKDDYISRYNQPINREEMVKILMNIIGHEETSDLSSYKSYIKDYDAIGPDYQPYILKAYATGIIKGYEDGYFRPQKMVSRAEAADVIYQLVSLKER
ncbi:S-layer homology domain-containing protein [Vallitalea pronyensis]|uniref:S-layer homology domain-containing protein n=1 Tax=Vallitalea pronyensis TaxID=1348613 RepID=A0A8J8ML68_9FIRM|nr:S-layer homology domain-containing protein [Vallitalea pronyensis]QUI23897.1 S-layer homology domain-containing protein [Vallitalea pronyensis]